MPTQDESQSVKDAVPTQSLIQFLESMETSRLEEMYNSSRTDKFRLEHELHIADSAMRLTESILNGREDWIPF